VGARGTRFWARVRWLDPLTGRRDGVKRSHACREDAELWVDRMRRAAQTGIDSGQTLRDYFDTVGNRWTRGIDPTSTYDPYVADLRRRVLPTLGHLPVSLISAGLVDRAIDDWEQHYGRSTVKNTVAALVLVLDEAVRDGIIIRNPAKDRARRRTVGRSPVDREPTSPRDLALARCRHPRVAGGARDRGRPPPGVRRRRDDPGDDGPSHQRGLRAPGGRHLPRPWPAPGEPQTYPGRGGLVTKQTKGRRRRTVPVIEPLRPTLARLTVGRSPEERLVTGPSWRRHHYGDAEGRHRVGPARRRPRATRPGQARPPAHGPDLDGRRGGRVAPSAAGRRPPGPGRDEPLPAP
jgi:hypothetical protein